MSKHEHKSVEEYGEVYDTYGRDFIEVVGEKVVECLDAYLTTIAPEPKNYADCRHLANALIDSVLLFLLAEEHVVLAEKSVASEELQATRAIEREERLKRESERGKRPSLGDEAESFLKRLPGQYL